jgi:hypothetical protein
MTTPFSNALQTSVERTINLYSRVEDASNRLLSASRKTALTHVPLLIQTRTAEPLDKQAKCVIGELDSVAFGTEA